MILKSIIHQGWRILKLGVAPKVGEKDVALKVGEKAASHLKPLHAPERLTNIGSFNTLLCPWRAVFCYRVRVFFSQFTATPPSPT